MLVIKRNGVKKPYQRRKVRLAISKANLEVPTNEQASGEQIDLICDKIEDLDMKEIHVETIQDFIEKQLMTLGLLTLAKKYIIYRYNRMLARKANTTDDSILSLVKNKNKGVMEENSNKNAFAASTQRDLIAGEVSKDLTWRMLLPKDVVEAHEQGALHFHDADYFLQQIPNCALINIKDMLDNGTMLNRVLIETPKSFSVACNVMTQIIASVASNQYGGQSVAIKHLGKYLAISREKHRIKTIERWNRIGLEYTDEQLEKEVEELTHKELVDGVQTIQYQIITLMSSNGQSPFLTLFLQIDDNDPYVEEVAMIVEEIIKQRIQGVKNKKGVYVTPAFPKLVYVLDENNNLSGGKYDYITKLCAECNVKRIYPDYISAKVMRELHEGQVYSCMGCVDGSERVKYSFNGFCYNEPIKEMYDRLSNSFESKLQNEQDTRHKYIDLNNVYIYDLKLDKYVSCTRIIRNVQIDWVKVTLSNSYVLDCTVDHPFETENRGIVQAKDLLSSDYILCDTGVESVVDLEFYNTEKFSYDVTTESEHFEISGIYSHNCRSFLSEWKVTEDMKNSCNLPDKVEDYKWEGRFNQGRQLCPLSA